ncbi:DUF2789 domain-containing protein [Pseudomonas sp. GCM10022188]|uniref:DUF2789 domain-containing protein n=1 Tax=Pseudomonas TaxID=286 RepID=UPI001E4FAB0A|nr:DUF2789 domain-containing protein [Pseudomonas oryzagri]MCC6073738.1 DUF2789 domain-containing protein [Pseudomonas oryzagri]
MEQPIHPFHKLFEQLGLPNDNDSIKAFIARHAPLPEDVKLADASFWTPAQAAFLREEILEDADWAVVVDNLNVALRTPQDAASTP